MLVSGCFSRPARRRGTFACLKDQRAVPAFCDSMLNNMCCDLCTPGCTLFCHTSHSHHASLITRGFATEEIEEKRGELPRLLVPPRLFCLIGWMVGGEAAWAALGADGFWTSFHPEELLLLPATVPSFSWKKLPGRRFREKIVMAWRAHAEWSVSQPFESLGRASSHGPCITA